MPNSNQRSLRTWSISLGPVHTVVVLGIFTGCLACAFILGLWLGQQRGVAAALDNNLSTAMRLPIDSDEEPESAAQEAISDVYAKLGSAPLQEAGNHKSDKGKRGGKESDLDIPELGSIKSAERGALEEAASALGAEDPADRLSGEKAEANKPDGKIDALLAADKPVVIPGEESKSASGQVRVLGEDAAPQGKTLGALAAESANDRVAEKAQQAPSGKAELRLSPDTGRSDNGKAVLKLDEPKRETAPRVQDKAAEPVKSEPEASKPKSLPRDTTLVTSTVPSGWFAQIIAPKTQDEAESMARRLKASGFSVVIENAKVRGEQYFRVLVGPEQNRQQAERLLTQLKRESYLKSAPFLRMVK